MSQIKIIGISQHQLADAAGCSWQKIQKLVAHGDITPAANIGGRLVFAPDDVEKAKAAITQSKQSDEAAYRPEWKKLTAKQQMEYGNFAGFVGFKKNESSVESFQGGRSWRASTKGAV